MSLTSQFSVPLLLTGGEVGETFGAVLIGHHDLVHTARREVVGEMDPPVIAGPAGLPQPCSIDQADPAGARRGGRRWRARRGDEFAQQPEQPSVAGAQALTPCGL